MRTIITDGTVQHVARRSPRLAMRHSAHSHSPSGMLLAVSPMQRRCTAAGQPSQQIRLPPSPHSTQLSRFESSSTWARESQPGVYRR